MRSLREIEQRVTMVENAKASLFCPPLFTDKVHAEDIMYTPGHINILEKGEMVKLAAPAGTLESLNAELSALRWVMDGATS